MGDLAKVIVDAWPVEQDGLEFGEVAPDGLNAARSLARPTVQQVGPCLNVGGDAGSDAAQLAASGRRRGCGHHRAGRFADWLMFGGKLIGHNDPDYHEKIIKFDELPANCVIYSTSRPVLLEHGPDALARTARGRQSAILPNRWLAGASGSLP
ncbi:hypothetical protein GCM10022224_034580 [Nonomuraea antimicrobica]|uniref:Uncharacterized protein n=1 Tax=Nonomuraea antimicrobica TaxID=561173 RepID=A0ABP7BUL8_9ACTN